MISKNTFTDFWKIPYQKVSFCEQGGEDKPGVVKIIMPAFDAQVKPELHKWGKAHLFASVHIDPIAQVGDISSNIKLDYMAKQITLPINLDLGITNLLNEQYLNHESNKHVVDLLRRGYYFAKHLLPRSIQIAIRRWSAPVMGSRSFPVWPVDISIDLIQQQVMEDVLSMVSDNVLPMISFWPEGSDFCLVLTHDVEQQIGFENIQLLSDIEKKYGFRSVWNFVPERYKIDYAVISNLHSEGFEVGVHGLYHDGRLFESFNTFLSRVPRINTYIADWGSVGFRSPSALRKLDWISRHIQTEYDSSCPTAELYGAQAGGCCTVFPFIYQDMIELPITMQQDHTLLEILEFTPEQTLECWLDTIKKIKAVHGMVLIIVHPDYMLSPERLQLYDQFLQVLSQEKECWHTLPRNVARWWKERSQSELINESGNWVINGPGSKCGQVMEVALTHMGLRFRPLSSN